MTVSFEEKLKNLKMFSAWANAKRNSAGDHDQNNKTKKDSSGGRGAASTSSASSSSKYNASTSSASSASTYKPYDASNRQSSSSSSSSSSSRDLPPGMVWSPYQRAPIDIAKRNALYQAESRRNIERIEARQQARRDARNNKEDLGYYSDK